MERNSEDNIKQTNICITEVMQNEKREKWAENLFKETMAENFLNLNKETEIQIQEA